MNYSCQWLSSAVAIGLTLLSPSQRMRFILPWTLLLVHAPSSGLSLQDMVATFIGLPSQKAAWESSLRTHQSSLLWVSSPDCQEYQRNWICRNPNSSPPAQGSPGLLYTDYTFLPAPSEWLTHCSLTQSAISHSFPSYCIPHRQPPLPKAVPRAPGQPPLPCNCSAEPSASLCPEHQHLDADWNSSASAAGEPNYIHTVYFRMRQFPCNRCSPFQSLVLLLSGCPFFHISFVPSLHSSFQKHLSHQEKNR